MLEFFPHKNKYETILIFDIGSGSVAGALVKIPIGQVEEIILPTILKSYRVDIKNKGEVDLVILLEETLKSLKQVSDFLYQSRLGVPTKIFCVLASPWYSSLNRTMKMSRPKSFVFNKSIAEDMLRKEISSIKSFYRNQVDRDNEASVVIESQIMEITANGYKCKDPIGVNTKEIEMNVLVSTSPRSLLDQISDVIEKNFAHTQVSFSSFALSSYLAVRDVYVYNSSYLLLDVSGEITDVSLVSDEFLISSISFPMGKNSIFRKLSKDLHLDIRDVEEIYNLYSRNSLDEKRKIKYTPIFESTESLWYESLKESLSKFFPEIIPETVFLTADDDIRPWISSIVKRVSPHVIGLDGPQFLPMCNVLSGPCDPFIMIESISIMRKVTPASGSISRY